MPGQGIRRIWSNYEDRAALAVHRNAQHCQKDSIVTENEEKYFSKSRVDNVFDKNDIDY